MSEMTKILKDPAGAFSNPSEVLRQGRLSREEKLRILRQWRYDLVQLQVASAENLTGNDKSSAGIRNIDECLRQVKAEAELA
ncbi:MAG: hypothetical protein WBM54_00090 [Woeseia sp.]